MWPTRGHGDGVYALDAATGAQKWYRRIKVDSMTTLAGPLPLVPGDDEVYAVDIATGLELWRFNAVKDPDDLVAAAGTVCFAVYDPTAVEGQFLQAVDAATGMHKWRLNPQEGTVDLAVDAGVFYACFDENLYALAPATGTPKWVTAIGNSSVPVVVEGMLYLSPDETVVAVDAATGNGRWTYETNQRQGASTPVVADGMLYLACGNTFYALDATTGAGPA